ncbi:hypothetical protein [Pseudoalteromonas ardens]|uniref:Uncharacterized protein n=1 Tax=Pseudoalteromonas rubra TaxID=43658 RepID=A0A0L0ET38_9GAMM|nr:hypothetical protein [Pseudoalteromonas sp. R96]KNC67652.1 hypothetical protein AC626_09480 [Pseudoalteromonas rubra]MDK1310563.1 hypothetical protein [Pseudoalteromonas sp. R96]
MKKSLILASLIYSSAALSGTGQALIPHYYVGTNSSCHLHITNISDNDVQVKIDLFDQNGNTYSSNITSWYAFSGSNPVTSTVALPAKKTGAISMNKMGSGYVGHGYIRWSNEHNQNDALVANFHCDATSIGQRSILINQQSPF